MEAEYLGNGVFREYLGAAFIQKLKDAVSKAGCAADLNDNAWRMEDKDFRFIKFDLEYVYYQRIL